MNDNTELGNQNGKQYQSDQSKKTRSVTFRLDSSILDELQHEADQREISLNVSVNQILKRYCQWDRYESRIGMMPVPKIMLSYCIDKAISIAKNNGIQNIELYRDEIIKQAAGIAFSLMKDSVLFMKKNFNLWVVLSVLEEYMKVSGIKADHKIEAGRKHVFVIQHELGENWSLFTKELLTLIFENLAKVRIECSITSNTAIAEVIL
jgi:predicted HicB family RNase H-like nuclease